MGKIYTALGLMSGTSMDGVDASIIKSDGKSKYKPILDKYFEYPKSIYKNLTSLRDKIKSVKDLKKHKNQIIDKERIKEIHKTIRKKSIFMVFILVFLRLRITQKILLKFS